MQSITDMINTWPTRRALAADIGANVDAVHKWAANNRVPTEWQGAVLKAARIRGYDFVTAEWMIAAHDRHFRVVQSGSQ